MMIYTHTDSITFNGRNSFLDFGLTMKSKDIGMPEKTEIRESVPYMQGDYDFSQLNGKPVYGNRTITVIFNLIAEDYDELFRKRSQVIEWLSDTDDSDKTLAFESMTGRHFEQVSARIPADGFDRIGYAVAELTVIFTAYPFLIEGTYDDKVISLNSGLGYAVVDILGNAAVTDISANPVYTFDVSEKTTGVSQYDCTDICDICDEMLIVLSSKSELGVQITVMGSAQSVLSAEYSYTDGTRWLYFYRFKTSEHSGAAALRIVAAGNAVISVGGYDVSHFSQLPINEKIACKDGLCPIDFTINGLKKDTLNVGCNVVECGKSADLVFILPKEVL